MSESRPKRSHWLSDSSDRETANYIVECRKAWRGYENKVRRGELRPDLGIGLAASFTVNPLIPFLGMEVLELSLNPQIQLGSHNQIFQVCLDPQKAFPALNELNIICLLWRIEDLSPLEKTSFSSGDDTVLEQARTKLKDLHALVTRLSAEWPGTVIINTPSFPESVCFDLSDLRNPQMGGLFHRELLAQFCRLFAGQRNIHLLDLDALQRLFGQYRCLDYRTWYLYRQPYSERFLLGIAATLGRMIRCIYRPLPKCIALDCDNTLWGGIVGEDGIAGIALGEDYPGKAYRDFQELLLAYHERGILLALLSKNNEPEVWNVFAVHDAMVLKRKHIPAWSINWQPKHESIERIAEQLNIGLDSIVFIDDSPFEIELMQQRHPEVVCLKMPDDPAAIVPFFKMLPLFDRLEITAEDLARTEMLSEERKRKELKRTLPEEDFLKSLELKLHITQAGDEQIERITQLINKTNQFNLTTIRRTREEVLSLKNSPKHRIYSVNVGDKFGNYGLTGVAVIEAGEDFWYLDTFLLSCRVLGRQVETAFLVSLAEEARLEGKKQIQARFISTRKNAPIADFLPRHGFKQSEDGIWKLNIADLCPMPPYILTVKSALS